jgi:hypothetical protein
MKVGLLSRLSIFGRLVLLAAVVAAAFLASFLVAFFTRESLSASLERQNAASTAFMRCTAVERLSYDLQIQLYRAVNYGNQGYGREQMEKAAAGMEKTAASFASAARGLSDLGALTAKEKGIIATLQATARDFEAAVAKAITAIRTNPDSIPLGEVEQKFQELSSTLTGFSVGIESAAKGLMAASRASSLRAQIVQGAVALAALALVLLVVVLSIRSITAPIRRLASVIGKVKTGDFREKSGIAGGD